MTMVMMVDKSFGFGKYRGAEVLDVLEIDPSYVAWSAKNGLISIDQDALQKAIDAHHAASCYAEAVLESRHGDWGNRDWSKGRIGR